MSKAKNHGALLYNMVNLKKTIFPGYNGEIYRILNKKDEVAHYADRADTLEGATPEEILAESRSLLAQHIANKNNPHQETPGSIGVLSADYVLNQLKNKVPVGMSPFDIFGYHTKTWNKENVNNKFTISGSNVSHLRQEVIIKGVLYTIAAGSQNLSSISSSWSNKLWYAFVVLEDGVARFMYSDVYLAESLFRIYIGSIHSGTGAKSLNPVVRLDTFRLSTTPLGSGIAVGLNGFDSSEGIDLGWRPGQNTLRPERPPKVDIWIVNYVKSSNGTSGYIDTNEYAGEKLLQVNQGVAPNINFGIDGDGVVVTASIKVHSGSAPTVTKVSNTQFRVSGNSYSLSTVTFIARNQYGDTESVYLHFEVRTNLTIRYGSATSAIGSGSQGGLTLITYRTNTDARVHLALTGDGVTTVLQSRTNTSGSGATVTQVNQTRYDIRGAKDNVMLLTFRATDRYSRTATFSMYVNVRTAPPPALSAVMINRGYRHRGHYDSCVSDNHTYPRWDTTHCLVRAYKIGSTVPTSIGSLSGYSVICHFLTKISDQMSVSFSTTHPGGVARVPDVPSQRFTGRSVPSGYYCDYIEHNSWLSGKRSGRFSYRTNITVRNIIGETKAYSMTGTGEQYVYREPSSCFTYDTLILMSDMSSKPISDIVPGDVVMGATGPTKVTSIDYPKLGGRKLLSFNGRCKTSPEHSIWSKCSNTGKEWWSTRDMIQWRLEASTDQGPDFGGVEPFDFSDFENKHLYATFNGFEELETTVHEDADPSTQLYHLITEEGGTYFVDGILVSSMATSRNNIDWTKFKWTGDIQYDYPTRTWRYSQQDRIEKI